MGIFLESLGAIQDCNDQRRELEDEIIQLSDPAIEQKSGNVEE